MSMFVVVGVIAGIGDRPQSSVVCCSKQKLTVGFGVVCWQLGLSALTFAAVVIVVDGGDVVVDGVDVVVDGVGVGVGDGVGIRSDFILKMAES